MSLTLLWFIIGLIFVIAEMAVPGFILIFFGLGAWVAAGVAGLTGLNLTWQIALFLIASVVLLLLFRRLGLKTFTGEALPGEEETPSREAVGRTAQVVEEVSPVSGGKIKFRGSFWQAASDADIPAGTTVVITGTVPGDNLTYTVKPVSQGENHGV